MSTVLAVLALILSLIALGVALRGRRGSGAPPAPPPHQPAAAEDRTARERLDAFQARSTALSQALDDLATRVATLDEGRGEETGALRADLAALETAVTALREASERAAAPPEDVAAEPPPEESPDARVRAHLQAEGWEGVVLLPDGEHAWRVEARGAGGLAKGRARLFPDGRVEARLAPPTRAFP